MNRRAFFRLFFVRIATIIAAMIPFGVAKMGALVEAKTDRSKSGRMKRMRLRPPGALADDNTFVSACIGCGMCAEVCPPRCITLHRREGGEGVNTPYIVPEQKACILCMKCGEVCPTDALQVIAHRRDAIMEKVDMGVAQIDRLTCYPWVNTGICGACANICPLGREGIGFAFAGMYRPVVQQQCVGCGQCVEICPHPSLPIRIVPREQGGITHHTVAPIPRSGQLPF